MTSDLTSLLAQAEKDYNNACKYGHILETLEDREREALTNTPLPATHVARIIRAFGHDVSERVVQRHRSNDCTCAR